MVGAYLRAHHDTIDVQRDSLSDHSILMTAYRAFSEKDRVSCVVAVSGLG